MGINPISENYAKTMKATYKAVDANAKYYGAVSGTQAKNINNSIFHQQQAVVTIDKQKPAQWGPRETQPNSAKPSIDKTNPYSEDKFGKWGPRETKPNSAPTPASTVDIDKEKPAKWGPRVTMPNSATEKSAPIEIDKDVFKEQGPFLRDSKEPKNEKDIFKDQH
jgi:hypothetical protein